MLHDAIEDVGADQEAIIAERFGARVARIVRACTDTDTTPKPPWHARKEAYVAHLAEADADALMVSAADKLHNARAIISDLRALGPAMFGRFTGGQDGTLWYYAALSQAFSRRLPGALAADLAEAVREMPLFGLGQEMQESEGSCPSGPATGPCGRPCRIRLCG